MKKSITKDLNHTSYPFLCLNSEKYILQTGIMIENRMGWPFIFIEDII